MRYLKLIAASLLVAVALIPAVPAGAQAAPVTSGYINVRGGPIVAYEWDTPKVVLEFGNISDTPIEAALVCYTSDVQVARVERVTNKGPFPRKWIAPDGYAVRFFESPQSPDFPTIPFVNGIMLPAHSTYRVAFLLRIYSEDGSDGTLTCSIYKSFGNHPIIYNQVVVPITVDTW